MSSEKPPIDVKKMSRGQKALGSLESGAEISCYNHKIVSEFDPDFSIIDGDFRIGGFHVRPLLKVIRPLEAGEDDEAEERRLPDKAMAVLLLLAENRREVCERDFLLDEVWGPERESYDRVLDNAIREIRRAFGDDARNPEYVQTIAKTGYRLIAEVERESWNAASRAALDEEPDPETIHAEADPDPVAEAEPDDQGTAEDETGDQPSGAMSPEPAGSRDVAIRPDPAPAAVSHRPPVVDDSSAAKRAARSDGWRTTSWPVIGALLLAVASSAYLASLYQSSDRLFVDVTLGQDAEGPPLDPAEVEEIFFRVVQQDHSCGSASLLAAGPRWLRPGSELPVTVRERRSDGRLHLESEISFDAVASLQPPPPGRVMVGLMESEQMTNGLERLADKTVGRIDGAICQNPNFPDRARSCHCIASFRAWAFPDDLQPHMEYLETGVRLDPHNLEALDHLVGLHLWAGFREKASREVTRGLEQIQDLDSDEALFLLRRLAQIHRDRGEEWRLLDLLHRRRPLDVRWARARAFFLAFHRHDCAGALAAFDSLVAKRPERSDVLGLRAETRHFCGSTRQARDELEEIIHASPQQLANQLRFIAISVVVGEYEAARNQAKDAFAVVPESNEIRAQLGRIERAAGAYRSADLWFERALEVASLPRERELSRTERAYNALLAGRTEDALQILATVDRSVMELDLFPLFLEGRAHLELGDLQSARRVADEMAALHAPRRTRFQLQFLLSLRARIFHAEGRHEEALETLDLALRELPFVRSNLLLAKAGVAAESGREELADETFRQLFGLNPNHGRGLCAAGVYYEETGNRELAREHLRRGLENLAEPAESAHGRECLELYEELAGFTER